MSVWARIPASMRSVSSRAAATGSSPVDTLEVGAPEGTAEPHGHPRARPLLARIRDPNRHDREPQPPPRPVLRLQRDAGGPGAKLGQVRPGMTLPLGIDLDRSAPVQHGHRVAEHVLVAVHRGGVVLPAIHGNAPEQAQHRTQQEPFE